MSGKGCFSSLTALAAKRNLLLACLTILAISCAKSHYPITSRTYAITNNAEAKTRGKNLVQNVCGQCHFDHAGTQKFTGKQMKDLPKFMGSVYSADLTDKGILTTYTDAQITYLLKTGISNTGKFIPYMVRPTMSDKDLNDIVVYLRSGDEPLKSNAPSPHRSKLSALGKLAIRFAGKPTPHIDYIKGPNENDPIAYGKYLVDIIGCYHCHSKRITGLNYTEPEKSKGYMAGGMKWKIDGEKIYSSNLTPCKTTGIGNYTKDDFRKAVREKIARNGRKLRYPMPKYPNLEDKQVDAIYAYLMSLPKEHHKVKGQDPQ